MSLSYRIPGYRNRSQAPPTAFRDSSTVKVFPGTSRFSRLANPTPLSPAPTINTSTCTLMPPSYRLNVEIVNTVLITEARMGRMVQRGRRSARVSGDERQDAILVTAEALLASRAFDDVSIEDLARGAGISRPTFYFYFPSKDAVLLALLDRVITEVEHRVGGLPRDFGRDAVAAWTRSIGVFVDVFTAHRGVATAAIAARARNEE